MLTNNLVLEIQAVMEQHPAESGRCHQAAVKIYNLLNNAGIDARIGHMETDRPFFTTQDGIRLSRTIGTSLAYHEFVEAMNLIFNSLTGSNGMPWKDYQNLFYDGVFKEHIIRVSYYVPEE